ncbi:hypothetical protein Pa4123_65600 [Phytohabitans aurantiacus]|uniref:Ricin B lectin domain-containing protein n=1 Tax=Phytohabitans aurantiacus TaxID=3016789 RepID=A0ABQ5R3C6_9ACTN|nr:hypothetical protein Pa4123_65600 [Phytohabitans aurantiacus]
MGVQVLSSKPWVRLRRGLRVAAAVVVGGVLALGNPNGVRADERPPDGSASTTLLPVGIVFTGGFGVPYAGGTDIVRDGIFAGLVRTDTSLNSARWDRLSDSYVGPSGLTYYRYRHFLTGECLSHAAGILLTEKCVWADESQWWGVYYEPTIPHLTDEPSAAPAPIKPRVLKPWDAPSMAASAGGDGLVYLKRYVVHQPSQWVIGVS